MRVIRVLLVLTALCIGSFINAAAADAYANSCDQLSKLAHDRRAPTQHLLQTDFFYDEQVRTGFDSASTVSVEQFMHLANRSADKTAYLAGGVMASIAMRNYDLFKSAFSKPVERYFESKNTLSPLTLSEACQFGQGIRFMIRSGISPNAGNDVGAFNIALFRHDYATLKYLLHNGYQVDSSAKRCKSSKYIVQHSKKKYPEDILDLIQDAKCID